MLTGWQKQSGKWYYLDENDNYGVMCIGEVNIDEKTYYFNQDGTMYTGWLKEIISGLIQMKIVLIGNILIKMDLCKSDGSL